MTGLSGFLLVVFTFGGLPLAMAIGKPEPVALLMVRVVLTAGLALIGWSLQPLLRQRGSVGLAVWLALPLLLGLIGLCLKLDFAWGPVLLYFALGYMRDKGSDVHDLKPKSAREFGRAILPSVPILLLMIVLASPWVYQQILGRVFMCLLRLEHK